MLNLTNIYFIIYAEFWAYHMNSCLVPTNFMQNIFSRSGINRHIDLQAKYITDAMRKGYKTNEELYAALDELHATYPKLTRVFSIGKCHVPVHICSLVHRPGSEWCRD